MNVVRTCFSSFKDIKLLHIGQIRSFTKRCLWDELIARCLFQSGLMNGAITLQIDDLIRRIVIRPVDCSRLTVFDFNQLNNRPYYRACVKFLCDLEMFIRLCPLRKSCDVVYLSAKDQHLNKEFFSKEYPIFLIFLLYQFAILFYSLRIINI